MSSIETSIEVDVPVRTAYNQWTQFEEFPRFMEGVREVKQLDDRHLRWCAEIGGKEKVWEAEISEQIPDDRVAWHSTSGAANAGVAVLTGNVYPHITLDGSEDRLAGYTAMPLDSNPYRSSYGTRRRIAAVILPAGGTYDVVFDSTNAGGRPFTFRYWVNDVSPPKLKLLSARGSIIVAATDAGSGVDSSSIKATLDGKRVGTRFGSGTVRIASTKGRHRLVLSVADYQETKNTEDVAKILPNTATLRATVTVR